jgi:small ligand-binding sensory domain FIST
LRGHHFFGFENARAVRLEHLVEDFPTVGVVFYDQDGEAGKVGARATGSHPHTLARDHVST